MAEVSKSAYRAKERERDRYIQEKRACEKTISSLNDDLAELNNAIKKMTQVYDDFTSQVSDMNKLVNAKRSLKGNQKKALITDEGGALLSEAKRCQKDVIKKALDKLVWLRDDKKKTRDAKRAALWIVNNRITNAKTWLKVNYYTEEGR